MRKPRLRVVLLALVATCAATLALGLKSAGVLRGLELQSVDTRFALRGAERPPAEVVVVGIDDATLNQLGVRWPFPRSFYGRVIDRLRQAGARTIAYDLQFTQPTSPKEDNALADAAGRARNVVFATSVVDRYGHTNVLGGDDVLRNLGARAGSVNFLPEPGGVIRHVPFAVDRLKSFAVVSAERFAHRPVTPAGFGSDGAWIDFRGPPGTVQTVSFARVLEGRVPASVFRGRLVVVGATASLIQDVHPTAAAPSGLMAGPELQANAIDTVLRGVPLRDSQPWAGVLLILGLALLPALAAARLGARWVAVIVAGTLAAFGTAAQVAFDAGTVVPVVYPVLALIASAGGTLTVGSIAANRERRQLRALFAQFLPEVVDDVLNDPAAAGGRLGLAASQVIAGYRLEQVIGRGGMGVVYRAVQLDLGRRVALKLMNAQYSDDDRFRERFKRESRLAASIEHPNVIPVYAAGEDEGLLYIVMRYVAGTDLSSALRFDGPLEPERMAWIAWQVAVALDAAHEGGLVHRDVKPANILLAAGTPDHAYLTDFGLAKRMGEDPELTRAGGIVGTVDYLAPEQIQGTTIDARADVYSLGCVIYAGLAGRPPFSRDDHAATLWAHVKSTAPPISSLVPGLRPGVDGVLAKALAKEPTARYCSAGALAHDLIDALDVDIAAGLATSSAAAPIEDLVAPIGDDAMPSHAPTIGGADTGEPRPAPSRR